MVTFCPAISPGAMIFVLELMRLLTPTEKLAMQGICIHDIHECNSKLDHQRLAKLAGEMLNQFSVCIYLVSLLSTVDL